MKSTNRVQWHHETILSPLAHDLTSHYILSRLLPFYVLVLENPPCLRTKDPNSQNQLKNISN